MKRRLMLGSMACAVLPSMAAALQPKALLTVSGRIGRVNNDVTDTFDFTESEFLKLGTASITTGTPWTPTSVFVGPLLIDVMRAAGVTSGTLVLNPSLSLFGPFPGCIARKPAWMLEVG